MKSATLPANETARLKALRETELLDTLPEHAFDDLARLAAFVCGTPIALVSLVDTARLWFKAKVGLTATETTREVSFCSHAILHEETFVVRDALADDRFSDNPLVTGEPKIRFYAGVPLTASAGDGALGTLCVIDRVPRDLTPEQQAALEAVGRQVLAQLDLRRQALERQRLQDLKDDLFTLILHDIRNPLSGVVGFVELLQAGLCDPGQGSLLSLADQAMSAAANLQQLVEGILQIRALEEGTLPLRLERVDVDELAHDAAASVQGAALARNVTVRVEAQCVSMLVDPTLVRRAIENLLMNAIKFSPDGETIVLSTRTVGDRCEFAVADRGPGISDAMKAVLFQKFSAGDGNATTRGFGLGLHLVRLVAEAHHGEVSVRDQAGGGTRMRLLLPVSAEVACAGLAT